MGASRPIDVFTHAGGRTLINKDQSRALGATNVGEVVARAPGVRSVEGNSGLGSQDTKLNVAVRGVNPRLSGRATVLLDEIPIAPAPYGQPQLSLFPLSLFSISEVDVVRGGATARYGPQTSGGVFNLISNPIPKAPAIAVFGQGDSNGDLSFGTSYGATHGRFGMYLEYAPRGGHSWREHSRKEIHGGIAKFAFRFNNRLELSSLSHGYYEDSELPGGLFRADYDENPFQNSRPFDSFRGSRLGTSLKLDWQPKDNLDVDFAGWYSHSYRVTAMASNPTDTRSEIDEFETSPRTYDVIGFEPRLAMRWDHTKLSHQLSVGARAAYELANIEKYIDDVGGRLKTQDGDARSAAYAAYVDEKLMFLDGDLVLAEELLVRLLGAEGDLLRLRVALRVLDPEGVFAVLDLNRLHVRARLLVRGDEGRSEGGRRSSQMQERDEYGQFTGYSGGNRGGSSRGGYDDDDRYGSSRSDSRGSSSRGGYDDEDRGFSGSSSRGSRIARSLGRPSFSAAARSSTAPSTAAP